jgi:hypothetical protein
MVQPVIIQAVFPDVQTRASVHFSHSGLEGDWGGDIVAVFSERDYVAFVIKDKGCITADLK